MISYAARAISRSLLATAAPKSESYAPGAC